MKLLRRISIALVILILLSGFGVVLLVKFVNPNQFKPILIAEVKKRTGYQLIIDGDLTWSFYPKLNITAKHMKLLQEAPSNETLVDGQDVSLAMSIIGLLEGKTTLAGNVYIAQVNLMKLNAQNARIGLHFQNGVLTLHPIVANLYSGKLQGQALGRDFATNPKWDFNLQLNSVQIKPLLIDVNGANSKLKLAGNAYFKINAQTQGKSKEEVLKNLQGSGQFNLKNGVLEGIDLNMFVQSADTFLNTHSIPLMAENKGDTAFDSITGSFNIQNGVTINKDLLLNSSQFTTLGQGQIDLVKQTIDYQLEIKPLHTTKVKWDVPLFIKGNIHNPQVRLNITTLGKIITSEEVDKVKEKLKKQINQLPEKANQFLQKFLRN